MQPNAPQNDALSQRYHDAVNELVWQLVQDEQVLAVLLEGSLAYDQVWHRSDVDMLIVVKDQKLPHASRTLLYQEVLFSISVAQRSAFIKAQNSCLTGSFRHSLVSLGKLLFLRDENLRPYFDQMGQVGGHDRSLQYLFAATHALFLLDKAEKWLTVKHDAIYAFHWLSEAVSSLAQLVVLLDGQIPRREVIQQAERLEPQLLHALYRAPCDVPKTDALIQTLLAACRGYLAERASCFFSSILGYLREERDARSVTEIGHHLEKQAPAQEYHFILEHCMPFLCELGLVEAVTLPIHLTPKSRVQLQEAAYLSVHPQ